jgi:hypothetical protein
MQNTSTYGRTRLWRYIGLWLFFVYQFVQALRFQPEMDTTYFISALHFLQFGVHEISHLAVALLPALLVAMAGSIGETAFTVLIVAAALRKKAYFWTVFGLFWVMLALRSTGRYMADAEEQSLQLMGPGPDPTHDWNFAFGELGWLGASNFIGGAVSLLGAVAGLAGLILGLAVIFSLSISLRKTTA